MGCTSYFFFFFFFILFTSLLTVAFLVAWLTLSSSLLLLLFFFMFLSSRIRISTWLLPLFSLFIIYGFLALMLYNQSLEGPFCFVPSHLSQQPTPKSFHLASFSLFIWSVEQGCMTGCFLTSATDFVFLFSLPYCLLTLQCFYLWLYLSFIFKIFLHQLWSIYYYYFVVFFLKYRSGPIYTVPWPILFTLYFWSLSGLL
jgi:hypothetical protein